MYLTQLLHRHAQCRPHAIALVCGAQRRSHAQLAARAGRLAALLQGLGVRAGDRVALLSAHSIETVELMFACWWIGAVFCPQNIRWSAEEIGDALLVHAARPPSGPWSPPESSGRVRRTVLPVTRTVVEIFKFA